MNVRCPECTTEYNLPEKLLGGRGARVRCPMCDHAFVVLREVGGAAGVATGVAVDESAEENMPPAAAPEELTAAERVAAEASSGNFTARDAESLAAELTAAPVEAAQPEPATPSEATEGGAGRVLDQLAERLGPGLAEARRDGRVLAAFGGEIVKVWDEYRKGQGEAAAATEFRAALLERFGVDLTGAARRP